jgi:hypothetical protein
MRTFSFYIHSRACVTPSLSFETAADETSVEMIAVRALAESPRRLLIEVREEDRLLFTLDRLGGLVRCPERQLQRA